MSLLLDTCQGRKQVGVTGPGEALDSLPRKREEGGNGRMVTALLRILSVAMPN